VHTSDTLCPRSYLAYATLISTFYNYYTDPTQPYRITQERHRRSFNGPQTNAVVILCSDVTMMQTVPMEDQTDSDAVDRPSPISASLLSQLPPPPQNDSEADIQVSYGSEDWHSAVPTVCVAYIIFDYIHKYSKQTVG